MYIIYDLEQFMSLTIPPERQYVDTLCAADVCRRCHDVPIFVYDINKELHLRNRIAIIMTSCLGRRQLRNIMIRRSSIIDHVIW